MRRIFTGLGILITFFFFHYIKNFNALGYFFEVSVSGMVHLLRNVANKSQHAHFPLSIE
jgi:hypothetical protein